MSKRNIFVVFWLHPTTGKWQPDSDLHTTRDQAAKHITMHTGEARVVRYVPAPRKRKK